MGYCPVNIGKAVKRECKRRGYSEKTVKTYNYCINCFLGKTNKTIDKISKKDVRLFLEGLSKKNLAGNSLNVYHMAIKFLMEDILHKNIKLNIKYSKIPKRLPVVLTKEEIKRLFNVIENPKHKLIVQLMYSSGLRVSELVNLKINDIKLKNNYGYVRHGKGNKDRLFIIAENIKEDINKIVDEKKLDEYNFLFISARKKQYNPDSIRVIIKESAKKAKINKKISCHTLRHSFATHLIENGYSVSEVQALLGHKSPKTTMVYLHTAAPNMIKVKSPLDSL